MEMNWLTLFLMLPAVIFCFLGVYGFMNRTAPHALIFSLVMFSYTIGSFGYSMEIASADLGNKLLWLKIRYIGAIAGVICWLLLALIHSSRQHKLSIRSIILVAVFPLVVLALFLTNDIHHLHYTGAWINSNGPIPFLEKTVGPLYWLYTVMYFLYMAVSTVIFLSIYRRSSGIYKQQVGLISLSMIVIFVAYSTYILQFRPLGHLNMTFFAAIITGVLLALSIFRYRFLDIKPIARNIMFDMLTDGVVVLDILNNVIDFNNAAYRMLNSSDLIIGESITRLFSGIPELSDRCY
jgi:hypothetical protein